MKKLISICLAALVCFTALAQQKYSGTVTDSQGYPFPGAVINVVGTNVNAVSDNNGNFTINAKAGQTLEVSCLGMESFTTIVPESGLIKVSLKESTEFIEETVVVGYGVTRKRDLAGAVSSIKADDIKAGVITNTADLLRGRAAGVSVRTQSYEPGGGINIRVRGSSSISANNEPLYVIDGIQTELGNTVSPEDIESIEVLKDAAATAIYGARGANGVVIITTKQGKAGKLFVDYSYSYSFKQLHNPYGLLNAEDVANLKMQQWEDAGSIGTAPYTDEQLAIIKDKKGTDWLNVATRPAPTQIHSVTVSGGNDKIRGAVSYNDNSDKGIIKNTDFRRSTVRANVDFNVTPWLTAGLNSYLAKADRTYVARTTSTVLNNTMFFIYTADPMKMEDGIHDIFGNAGRRYTIMDEITGRDLNVEGINAYYTVFANAKFYKDLNLRVQYSRSFSSDRSDLYYGQETSGGNAYNGLANVDGGRGDYKQLEGVLTYDHDFAHSNLKVIGGTSYQFNTYSSWGMSAQSFTTDAFATNAMDAAGQINSIYTNKSDKTNLSFFARAEYVLLDKYILNASIRADGASNFGENHKWGYFPAVSAAWQIGDEPWMKWVKPAADYIKLRASWGQTGNDGIGSYNSLRRYSFGNVYLGGTGIDKGMWASSAGNTNLRWETTTQFDLGFDISFFKNKLEITADYYNKLTTDLLNDVIISSANTGFTQTQGNNGSVRNRGFEFFAKYHPISKKNFDWTTTLNLSRNENLVVELGSPSYYLIRPHGSYNLAEYAVLEEGQSLSSLFGYVWEGIIQEGETYAPQPKSAPGDPKFKDVDGDGAITPADRTVLGKGEPDILIGWGNTFRLGNFDFNFFFDAAVGNKMLNLTRVLLEDYDRVPAAFDAWTKRNPSTTVIRTTWQSNSNIQYGDYVNSNFVEDASYLRLSNIELGYNVPCAKLGIDNILKAARVYIGANRLFTLTKYTGFDPEVSTNEGSTVAQGLDYSVYPAYKTFNAGVKVTF